jgi:hypothetical protein
MVNSCQAQIDQMANGRQTPVFSIFASSELTNRSTAQGAMKEKESQELLRRLVREHGNYRELEKLFKRDYNTIRRFARGERDAGREFFLLLCDHFKVDPMTAERVQERKVRGVIKRNPTGRKSSMFFDAPPLPDEIELTESEAHFILARRQDDDPYWGIRTASETLGMGMAAIPRDDHEARVVALGARENFRNLLDKRRTQQQKPSVIEQYRISQDEIEVEGQRWRRVEFTPVPEPAHEAEVNTNRRRAGGKGGS